MKLLEWVSPQVTEFIYTVLLYPRPLRAIAQRIIKAAIPPTLTVNGVRMVLNQDDPVLCGALALGAYERFELSVFRDTLKPGMNVLDIGANIGLFAAAAALIVTHIAEELISRSTATKSFTHLPPSSIITSVVM